MSEMPTIRQPDLIYMSMSDLAIERQSKSTAIEAARKLIASSYTPLKYAFRSSSPSSE